MKFRKILSLLLVVVLAALCMTACGGKNENAQLVGTWVYETTLVNGESQDEDKDTTSDTSSDTTSDKTESGEEEEEVAPVTFIFRKSGKGERLTNGKKQFSFEYVYDGEVCVMKNVINANGTIGTSGSFPITVEGNKMTIRSEGEEDTVEIVFTKQ